MTTILRRINPYKPHVKWTNEEHEKLLKAVLSNGKNYEKISEYVGSRTKEQIRKHIYKIKHDQCKCSNKELVEVIKEKVKNHDQNQLTSEEK